MRAWWERYRKSPYIVFVAVGLIVVAVVIGQAVERAMRPSYAEYQAPLDSRLSNDGQIVEKALRVGQTCSGNWVPGSGSRTGSTDITGTRILDGKTQLYVYHSKEQGSIWVWEDRISSIRCG